MICRAIPYEGHEPYIFFSYSHKDAALAYPLLEELVRQGHRIWYDDGNHPGDDWAENIAKHLNDCRVCLVMLSKNSSESHNCRSELNFALTNDKKVMAVMLEQYPMSLGMRMQLGTIHYLRRWDYFSDMALLQKLTETEEFRVCCGGRGSMPMRRNEGPTKEELERQKRKQEEEAQRVRDWARDMAQLDENTSHTRRFRDDSDKKKKEKERLAKLEAERQAEQERQERERQARLEAERKAEQERQERERQARLEAERKAEQERQERERQARLEAERKAEQERQERERQARLEAERKAEQERQERERQARLEAERLAALRRSEIVLVRLNPRKVMHLNGSRITLGRSRQKCDVVLDNPHVSSRHAELILDNGRCFLRDLDSLNGTYCMGQRLGQSPVELTSASAFQLYQEIMLLLYGPWIQNTGAVGVLISQKTLGVRVITEDTMIMGRHHVWNDGTFKDPTVGRAHASVYLSDGCCYIEDNRSINGTYINGVRLPSGGRRQLQDQDIIRIGETQLTFCLVSL